jgi:predicted RNA polymerase sigma factor
MSWGLGYPCHDTKAATEQPDERRPGHRARVATPSVPDPSPPSTLSISVASRFDSTDWSAILTLYGQLYALTPTPVVALNRAVALAKSAAPQPARPQWTTCDRRVWSATTCSMRHAPTCDAASAAPPKPRAYATARSITANPVEQGFFHTQRATLSRSHPVNE